MSDDRSTSEANLSLPRRSMRLRTLTANPHSRVSASSDTTAAIPAANSTVECSAVSSISKLTKTTCGATADSTIDTKRTRLNRTALWAICVGSL